MEPFLSKLKTVFCILTSIWCLFTLYDILNINFSSSLPAPREDRNWERKFSRNVLKFSASEEEVETTESKAEDSEYERWLRDQNELKRTVKEVCAKYGDSVRLSVPSNQFMYDPQHSLLFCRNAKVGTTTWLTNFLLLSDSRELYLNGSISSKSLHVTVPKMFPLNKDLR